MSRLDELIRELCPGGVEYKRLEECCTLVKGKTPIQKAEPGEYPLVVTTSERRTCSTYQFDKPTVCIPLISSRGHGVASLNSVYYQEGKFALGNILCGVTPNDEDYLSAKFLFEYLNYKKDTLLVPLMKGGANVSMTVDSLKRVSVPVPPMQVQMEAVGVLNRFTNLLMELNAELIARKTQYAYYRDELLQYKMPTKEYEVGEICEVSAGGDAPKEHFSKEKSDQYKVPIISNGCGINALYGYTDVARVDKPAVTVAARGTIGYAEYRDYPYFPIIRLITLIPRDDKQLNAKYLYYSLEGRHYKVPTSGIPQLTVPVIKKEKVSIPSLDVQNRIVNVLDNFEKICSDLNIGLPAEIEARQKQYEYYRDKLLTFVETGNTILSRAEQSRAEQSRAEQSRALIKLLQYVFGYAVVSLQDVVKKSCSGGTPKKGVSEYYEGGNIPWLRTQEVVFRDICKTECFITESAVKNSAAKWIPENCVIVAISGATAGRCAINKIPLTTNQHCLNLEIDPEMALYRYVYYCICAKQEELLAKKEGARGDLNSTRILSLQIDLPALEEQKRIVSILDRFDAICNDLTSGLPAEIEARKKQYEYYRDKLLTFKEVAAT